MSSCIVMQLVYYSVLAIKKDFCFAPCDRNEGFRSIPQRSLAGRSDVVPSEGVVLLHFGFHFMHGASDIRVSSCESKSFHFVLFPHYIQLMFLNTSVRFLCRLIKYSIIRLQAASFIIQKQNHAKRQANSQKSILLSACQNGKKKISCS